MAISFWFIPIAEAGETQVSKFPNFYELKHWPLTFFWAWYSIEFSRSKAQKINIPESMSSRGEMPEIERVEQKDNMLVFKASNQLPVG